MRGELHDGVRVRGVRGDKRELDGGVKGAKLKISMG
jgi:hypothetical protein